MFIDTIPNRKSPPAVLLRESYREGGRVKKRTLANLSKLPQALIEGIVALLDGAKVSGKRTAEPGFEIVRSLPHGHVAAVQAMIRKLGLDRMLQGRTGVEKRVCNLIEALIIQRIIAPGSKLAFHRALAPATATSSLALSVGLIDVAEREVYAALDWLIEQQTRIEGALAKRHLTDGTLVLYDVSSSYMEGRCCALAKPGYSRDHRPDRPQIVYGLLCAPDGTPVAVEVFEGNTSDPQTIREQIDKLKRRFKLSHVALVGDRGMITSARITEELAPAGLDWISCLRAPQIAALAADTGPLQLSLFDDRDLAEITSPDFPGERLVACRNPALAKERARKREELLQATERRLTRIANEVRRKPAKHDAGVIGLAVGAVIDKHKMKKHFALDIADGRFTFHRRQEEIAAEARLDGIYVIRTSLPADKIGSQAAVAAYKNLALVERAFRTLKGVDLQVRPVHHWLGHRVKAHVFLCMLAYYVEHHMRNALAPILFADHQPQARERTSIVMPIEKRTKRETANHGLARSHRSPRHTDDQRGGAAARRAPHNPDACPPSGPTAAGFRAARRAASSCPVADRSSEKECESDQAVTCSPSEKFGLATGFSFAGLGCRRPRRSASVVTAASSASISASSNRLNAPAKSLGKKWRGWEARLSGTALPFGTAKGPAASAVGGAENKSGVVSAGGRIGMPPIMPPASHRETGWPDFPQGGGAVLVQISGNKAKYTNSSTVERLERKRRARRLISGLCGGARGTS